MRTFIVCAVRVAPTEGQSDRVISWADELKAAVETCLATGLQAVTPDAGVKTDFVIVDAVRVVENEEVDAGALERKRAVPFDKLLEALALGARDDDTLTSLAGRLARLEKALTDADRYPLAAARLLSW